MDHLPIPPALRDYGIDVPRLREAPCYDQLGFEGFLRRVGFDENTVLLHSSKVGEETTENRQANLRKESILQEWLWFGVIHEFEIACETDEITTKMRYTNVNKGGEVLDTRYLVEIVRKSVIRELLRFGVPLDLQIGDHVKFGKLPADKPQIGPTKVTSIDRINLTASIGEPELWTGPLEYLQIEDNTKKPQDIDNIIKPTHSTSLNVLIIVLKKARRYYGTRESKQRRNVIVERLSRCLKKAVGVMNKIIHFDKPILRLEIALSISILCETIQHLIEQIWGTWIELNRDSKAWYQELFRESMISGNWCPARIETLLAWTAANQYISSLLPSLDTVSHLACSSIKCVQKPSNPEDIKPQHLISDCKCEVVVFDEAELIRILDEKEIPGLSRTEDEKGCPRYEVINVTEKPFIAISHVFNQGRGNSTTNALPKCQLEMLFKAIHELDSEASLWIDTICVPIHPTFKRRAIARLRDIYIISSRVLVIDRRLMKVGNHWMERRLQVLASEWMGRLWTLQEGRLASELYFRFKDEAVAATELINAHPDEKQEDLASLTRCFAHTGKENRVYFEKQDSMIKKFLNLIEDLSQRSVTFPSDEPICIATLLGLRLEDFHPYPTMIDIYRSVEVIPPEVLFVSAPRINLPGFRWAPTTFLNLDRRWFIEPDKNVATLTPHGLELKKDCIFLSSGVDFEHGNMCFININGGKSKYAIQRSKRAQDNKETRMFKDTAIIIERDEGTYNGSCSGVLVNVQTKPKQKKSSLSASMDNLIIEKGGAKAVRCIFELLVVVFPINDSAIPEIERRKTVRDIDLEGDFRRQVKLCVD